MPTLPQLRKAVQRAVAAAMMTSPALAGCGPGAGIEDDADFVPIQCEGGKPLWLRNLQPEPAVDFLELVGIAGELERQGEACKTASVPLACESALAALRGTERPPSAFRIFTGQDHYNEAVLNVTRGDEVFRVDSRDALVSLLGAIDTPQEAMLLTQASHYNVECKDGGARPRADGFETQAFLGVGCGGLDRFLLSVEPDGSVEQVDKTRIKEPKSGCVVGRRPAGLRTTVRAPCRSAGEYLARASTLEAASVEAFRRLAVELAAHGAAPRLLVLALQAARDEVRHAQLTARLARRMGQSPELPRIERTPVRELEAIATENAVEGCVRETFGALEGRWQALHAADPVVRRAYRGIAEDELHHAALSWHVARWVEPRLHAAAQRRVSEARRAALADLREELEEESSAPIRRLCGVPSAGEARVLFSSLSGTLG